MIWFTNLTEREDAYQANKIESSYINPHKYIQSLDLISFWQRTKNLNLKRVVFSLKGAGTIGSKRMITDINYIAFT